MRRVFPEFDAKHPQRAGDNADLLNSLVRLVGDCGRLNVKRGHEAFIVKASEAAIAKERGKREDYRIQLTKQEAPQAEIAALQSSLPVSLNTGCMAGYSPDSCPQKGVVIRLQSG